MNLVRIATCSAVPDGTPTAAMAESVDLVIIRRECAGVCGAHGPALVEVMTDAELV
jgi:hypothetical protein